MRRALTTLLAVYCVPLALGCASTPEGPPPDDPACQLDSKSEQTPGFPFSLETFNSQVLPAIVARCGNGTACHAQPVGNGGFVVFADAAQGNCNFAKTFNSLGKFVDLTTAVNSRAIQAVTGGSATHPFTLQAASPELKVITDYVNAAAKTFADGGGGGAPPPGPSPFNYATFQSQIQPAVDAGGCTRAACHGNGIGGFTMKATPAAGSADMEANFVAITTRTNLATPEQSSFYIRSKTLHGNGASTQVTPQASEQILAWITEAKGLSGGGPPPNCAPVDAYNTGTFASEIVPILDGRLDLNNAGGVGNGAGCTSQACHGIDRGPGKLSLVRTADVATRMQNFLCFVDLSSPARSEILACPTDGSGCRIRHPGEDVLNGAIDLNYQRILSFIYGGKAATSPFDYAFFVRKINPIFNDVNAVENGAQGITCSDTRGCHGTPFVGGSAPNGSDFPIVPNASQDAVLTANFVTATQFVTFLNPEESSLFLYPTNEIANVAERRFATGIPHPGGPDFAVDDEEALLILQWAGGLRPDAQGFQRNWLVGGDYPATLVTDTTLINEATVAPRIFDRSGGALQNADGWDGFFSAEAEVDLNIPLQRAATDGRIAYAFANMINIGESVQPVQIQVVTNNPIAIFINGEFKAINDAGGGATAVTTLQPSGENASARILIKILQRAQDADFAFTAQLKDDRGVVLNNSSSIVFTLAPNGGI